ncbi:MAG: hypothetical protein L0Z70_03655 [Chloroflexi bacterium]|nr:hypothetical protein [Chloroflexota bacterium]
MAFKEGNAPPERLEGDVAGEGFRAWCLRFNLGYFVLAARRTLLLIFLSLAVALLAACDGIDSSGDAAQVTFPNDVDPIFREFYDHLGGASTLGAPISPMFTQDGVSYQYTAGAIMVYTTDAPASQRYSLGAIGMDMEINEPAVAKPGGGIRYLNGHVLGKEFDYIYDVMGGARYVGSPITEAHFNADKRRTEQFFENVGFYLNEGDSPEQARLLEYGAWLCESYCQDPGFSIPLTVPVPIHQRFLGPVERLGAGFTGSAIKEAYETADGYIEQVFSNVVLISEVGKPRRVSLRPITQSLGMSRETPVPALDDPNYFFFPTDGNLGYNVPRLLLDYLAQHGSTEISGPPIMELIPLKENTYRQCFTNVCLLLKYTGGEAVVEPEALGYTYRDLGVPAVESSSEEEASQSQAEPQDAQPETVPEAGQAEEPAAPTGEHEIVVQVWEVTSPIPPGQGQEIGVSVFENGSPVKNMEPDLEVTLPDGSQKRYYMYPTTANGQTTLVIDPIDAPSGTLIPYRVCITNLGGGKLCVQDSFLIWQNP